MPSAPGRALSAIPVAAALAAIVMALAIGLRIADPDPIARLRHSIFDSYQRAAPRIADPAFPVRIVDVDEASLAALGQWPWPRTTLARIIDRLGEAGARVVALDVVLAEPDRMSPSEIARHVEGNPALAPLMAEVAKLPSNDEVLAATLRRWPTVAGFAGDHGSTALPGKPRPSLAVAGDDPLRLAPAFSGAIRSLASLAESARGEGAVNWLPADDQIVRKVPLLVGIGGTLYPTLAIEALRVAANETTLFVRSSGGSGTSAFGQRTGIDTVRLGSSVFHTAPDGQLWLHFAPHDPRRYLSAHKVLASDFDPREVQGRLILIGASATGLLDTRASPLSPTMPGVEIHAQALEQMLGGSYLTRPALATGAEILFILAAGALVATLIARAGPVIAAIIGLAAIAAVATGSWLAFRNAGYLFDPVYPSIALVAVYLTGSLATYIRTETDRARVRNAFSHYVAPQLVEDLARNHDRLRLGGETREVTLLFADVRGFSRMSEGLDAEQVIALVNRIFTPLSDVILAHEGTIDKFMGDAVMAFWNAPVADPEHAAKACRAALAMQASLVAVNEAAAEASPDDHVPVRIGIGLNTGDCSVGNVGSPQRFDYSVLGDAVNVASRLEETTKTFKMPIIAGERTRDQAAAMAWIEIGSEAIRGKARRERLFALVGDETLAQSAAFGVLSNAIGALRTAIDAGDGAKAEAELALCRKLDAPHVEGLITAYAARIAAAGHS